jgi:purine-binding chemotaxis protein CheW
VMPQAMTVPVSLLERAPDFLQTLPAIQDKYVEGLIRLPDSERVVILLDLLRLLRPEEILQLPLPENVSGPAGEEQGA